MNRVTAMPPNASQDNTAHTTKNLARSDQKVNWLARSLSDIAAPERPTPRLRVAQYGYRSLNHWGMMVAATALLPRARLRTHPTGREFRLTPAKQSFQ